MAKEVFAGRRDDRLTERELEDGFLKLVANEWRVSDTKPFLRRLTAVPSVSAPYLVNALAHGGPRERETATSLLRLLAGPRVIVPLRDVLRDRGLSDEARVSAAMVLEGLGEPVDIGSLTAELNDAKGLFDSVWAAVIEGSQDESFLESLLQSIESGPATERDGLIRSLAEPGDTRSLQLLQPLLHSKRVGAIIAAIDAIDLLGGASALPALQEVAEGDPSAKVRQRARVAYGRLHMRSQSFFPDPVPTSLVRSPVPHPRPLYRSWVTLVDVRGQQAVMVACRRADGKLKVMTTMFSDTEGIRDCIGVDAMRDDELAGIEAELVSQGLHPVDVDPGLCRTFLDEARKTNVRERKRIPMSYVIWDGVLESPKVCWKVAPWEDTAKQDDIALLDLLPQTDSLLAHNEFRQWVFNRDIVWPFVDEWAYTQAPGRNDCIEQETLDQLITLAAADIIDEEMRRKLSGRLRRQAWLLERLGKLDIARLSWSAAMGLDPIGGVPLEVHPFVRAMVLSSFYAAGLRLARPGVSRAGWQT